LGLVVAAVPVAGGLVATNATAALVVLAAENFIASI
jgi:hypothetical protein